MILRSPGFAEGELIPWRYSSPAQNELPPLAIAGVPEDARSLALVFESSDSGAHVIDTLILVLACVNLVRALRREYRVEGVEPLAVIRPRYSPGRLPQE